MDSLPKPKPSLAPEDTLKKRPSGEALRSQDSKKRIVGERTSQTATSSVPTNSQARDLRISPDPDPSPDDQSINQIKDLIRKPRILRKAHLPGEKEQSTWARCCHCEESGSIMSWPQCRHCLHNRCNFCVLSDESDNLYNDDKVDDRPTAQFSKLNELTGEMCLVLESLNLTPRQNEHRFAAFESLKRLEQAISEMEDAGREEEGPDNAAN